MPHAWRLRDRRGQDHPGYKLPARHVVHAVGPVWHGGGEGEEEALASCYRRAIELCQTQGLAAVAFPAISTGVYRFPADRAARLAVKTVIAALKGAPAVTRVIFCCFSEDSARLHTTGAGVVVLRAVGLGHQRERCYCLG